MSLLRPLRFLCSSRRCGALVQRNLRGEEYPRSKIRAPFEDLPRLGIESDWSRPKWNRESGNEIPLSKPKNQSVNYKNAQ